MSRCLSLTVALFTVAWGVLISCAEEEPGANSDPAINQSQPTPAESEATTSPPTEDALMQVKKYIQEKTAAGQINKNDPNWRTQLPKFPTVTFDPGTEYDWNLKTSLGDITIKLLPAVAPNHVANYLYLSELGFFDGLVFHRVIQGFMAQGGCPVGNGTGNPGYGFNGEFSPSVKHTKGGLLSMANAGPGTDGSQFFITFKETPWLDGRHTIFGEVTEGMGVVQEMEKRGSPDGSGRTSERLVIDKAWITTRPAK